MSRKSRPFFLNLFCVVGVAIFGAPETRAEKPKILRAESPRAQAFFPRVSSDFPPSVLRSLNQTIEFINEDLRSSTQEKKLQIMNQCLAQKHSKSLFVLPAEQSDWATWIQERIKIFFFEDENVSMQLQSAPSEDAYPFYAETLQRVQDLGSQSALPSTTSRLATHVASDFYLKAKLSSQLFTLDSPDFGSLPLLSPRAGWVVIFRELFSSRRSVNFLNPEAESNLISRAAVLFHEARHSDGHGKFLGFMHVSCPKGHEAEGIAACDDEANGAFRASAEYLERKIRSCVSCRESEKQALGIVLLDQLNRLTKLDDSTKVDETPEFLQLKK